MRLQIKRCFGGLFVALMIVGVLASCNFSEQRNAKLDNPKLMKYVTCSEEAVDSMLAIGDSVFAQINSFKAENLELGYDEMNAQMDSMYGKKVSLLVALLESYDKIKDAGDEINTVFVWHELAKKQIALFLEKPNPSKKEIDSMLEVFDGMLEFNDMTQRSMNISAWQDVTLHKYKLVDSYKQLIDICEDDKVVEWVQSSYQNVLDSYNDNYEKNVHFGSIFPLEMGCAMIWLLDHKREEINELIGKYKCKKITIEKVKEVLTDSELITVPCDEIL